MNYGLIHKYTQNGYFILIDTNSGTVHAVTELVYKLLDHITPPLKKTMPSELSSLEELSGYDKELIEEAYQELYELFDNGMLFSTLPELEYAKVDYDHMPIKSMCLHIAHDCNMRCKYCFAETGSFNRARKLMSYEVGKEAIDFLIRESKGIKHLELDFFGGEPLLNFDTVKRLVEYGRQEEKKHNKVIRFTMTTNGVLLDDETIEFLNKEMSNIVLSCDGRKCVNDTMRPMEDGSGSYDLIMPGFKKLASLRGDKDYYIRGTYTAENLDFSRDVLALAAEGFDQISVEPVVLPDDSPYALKEEHLHTLFREYERLTKEMIKRNHEKSHLPEAKPFNFFHFMIDLDAGPCVYKRMKGCGSGSEYISVTPEGDIYPCHQFADKPEFKIGTLKDGITNKEVKSCFGRCPITTSEDCKNCWAKFYCGGGCAANNYAFNKDINKPYKIGCELERKRVECAIAIKLEEAFEGQ